MHEKGCLQGAIVEAMADAKQLADKFANVPATSFLAHTIRMMEEEIFRLTTAKGHSIVYRINVKMSENATHALCNFAQKNCTIFLPKPVNINDTVVLRELRLKLAHELGHIAVKLDEISDCPMDVKRLSRYDTDEEIQSWVFAYKLISNKNRQHINHDCDRITYETENQIVCSMCGIISKSDKDDKDKIIAGLNREGIVCKS